MRVAYPTLQRYIRILIGLQPNIHAGFQVSELKGIEGSVVEFFFTKGYLGPDPEGSPEPTASNSVKHY